MGWNALTLGILKALLLSSYSVFAFQQPSQKDQHIMNVVTGSFEVKLTPVGEQEKKDGAMLGNMSIEKQYQGPLTAAASGTMLSAMTEVKGSAAYVAIEHVTGSLQGRTGSFVLQHHAWMAAGTQHLEISVVPDSGTKELKGLKGSMKIRIEEGHHYYDFDYQLPHSDQ